MKNIACFTLLCCMIGCGREEFNTDLRRLETFAWSEPVWLGPVVNSVARDWRPLLSTDGLRLYFHSDRDGGFDIWMSRRQAPGCPWQAPVKMGPPISTDEHSEGDPFFTPDGRIMFFSRTSSEGDGLGDIVMSRQKDPNDDLSWEEPVSLGPEVNTAGYESGPAYVPNENGGTLYFTRSEGSPIPPHGDIYKISMTRDGRTSGSAVFVTELNADAPIGDHAPTVRADGCELIFWSGGAAGSRPGGVGLADLWVSTRKSPNDPWSDPRNLGMPVNSASAELSATLSQDGRTLLFTSARPGGLGQPDLWMSTRGPDVGPAQGRLSPCPPEISVE